MKGHLKKIHNRGTLKFQLRIFCRRSFCIPTGQFCVWKARFISKWFTESCVTDLNSIEHLWDEIAFMSKWDQILIFQHLMTSLSRRIEADSRTNSLNTNGLVSLNIWHYFCRSLPVLIFIPPTCFSVSVSPSVSSVFTSFRIMKATQNAFWKLPKKSAENKTN